MSTSKCSWREGARVKATAAVAWRELERIKKSNDGRLKAKDIVQNSKPKEAPLHNEFEWNTQKAAQKYREEQARYVVRVLRVEQEVPADDKEKGGETIVVTTRAYVQVDEDGERSYTTMAHAMSDAELRHQVLYKAHKALINAKREIAEISELSGALDKLDEVIGSVDLLLKREEKLVTDQPQV